MTQRKEESTKTIEQQLIADAANPDAWEVIGVVPASNSPRPAWYGKSTDKASAQAASDQNEVRFKTAYERYYSGVVSFYLREFRFPEREANELAQQAFVRLHETLQQCRSNEEWAYLQTIARRLGANQQRTTKNTLNKSAK